MATKRLEYIDAMRGFTMILVVFAHIINMGYGITDSDAENMATFNNLFVRFRMPLFFFVSGFVLYKEERIWTLGEVKSFLSKKFMVQIVPTVIFISLFSFLHCMNFQAVITSSMKAGYWFTIALFLFFLVYACLMRMMINVHSRYRKDILLLIIALALYIVGSVYRFYELKYGPINFLNFIGFIHLRFFLFFIIGCIVKRNYSYFIGLMEKQYISAVCIILFVISFFVVSKFFNQHTYNTVMFIPQGILGIFIILMYFKKNEQLFLNDTRIGGDYSI